jgi:hypothetical protein
MWFVENGCWMKRSTGFRGKAGSAPNRLGFDLSCGSVREVQTELQFRKGFS